jgi:hypothetical protein
LAKLSRCKPLARRKLLYGVEIWRVRWEVQQPDTCIRAQLLNSVRMMEGCIIHNKDGLWLRPPSTVLKELLNKRFKQHGIR